MPTSLQHTVSIWDILVERESIRQSFSCTGQNVPLLIALHAILAPHSYDETFMGHMFAYTSYTSWWTNSLNCFASSVAKTPLGGQAAKDICQIHSV